MNNLKKTYIDALISGGKSPDTIRVYEKDLGKFFSYFGEGTDIRKLDEMKVSDFSAFFSSQKNLSPVSLNGLIRSVSAFLSWLENSGMTEKRSSFFKLKFGNSRFVKVEKVKRIVLTDEEITGIIKGGSNVQEKFMIALMLFTGLRRSEICNIKISDISGCEVLIKGKGGKQRKVYLNEMLCSFLSIYMSQRETENPYLFYGKGSGNGKLSGTSVNNRVKRAAKNAGISPERVEKITAHRLRGTAITEIIRQFGIQAAQKVAGHESISTTLIYDGTGDEVVESTLMNLRMGKR